MSKFLFYDDQAINVLLQEERLSGGAAVQAHGWMQGFLSEGHEVALITDLFQKGPIKDEGKSIRFLIRIKGCAGLGGSIIGFLIYIERLSKSTPTIFIWAYRVGIRFYTP